MIDITNYDFISSFQVRYDRRCLHPSLVTQSVSGRTEHRVGSDVSHPKRQNRVRICGPRPNSAKRWASIYDVRSVHGERVPKKQTKGSKSADLWLWQGGGGGQKVWFFFADVIYGSPQKDSGSSVFCDPPCDYSQRTPHSSSLSK